MDELRQTQESLLPSLGASETVVFPYEPLLLRLDMATYAFYQTLREEDDACEKRMLEIATAFANVSVQTRLVSKKDIKKYGRPDHQATTHDIIVRYQEREKQLLQSGTWDMQWGLRWLLSFIVLIETPVLCIINAKAMLSVVSKWICALKEAHIQEVEEQFSELEQITCVASDELVASLSVSEKLPGGFNAACSLVFAGDLKEAFVDLYMPKWALADHGATTESRYAAAQNTANSGLSLAAARGCVIQVFDSEDLSQVVCTHSIACDLRVSEIAGSGNGECDKDGYVVKGKAHHTTSFHRVYVYMYNRLASVDEGDRLTLYLESDIVAELRPGFVLETTLHTLNNGYYYIDSVTMVWPSYTPLEYVDTV